MKYLQAHALFFRVGLRPDWKLHSVVRGGWFLADAHLVLFTFYAKSSRTISILTQHKTDVVVAFRGVLFIYAPDWQVLQAGKSWNVSHRRVFAQYFFAVMWGLLG